MHRTILAVDVERFGDRRRTHPHQIAVRDGLYRALRQAFARCGVPWDACYREDRGDGLFVLIPPEVPKYLIVAALPVELAAGVAEHNAGSDVEAWIRLRIAVHAGEVQPDAHGVVGTSVTFAFRLLDAGPAKSALAGSPGVVALIVSDWFFDEVIRHDPACQAATYRRVLVSVKETDAIAWISLPDHPYPPSEETITLATSKEPVPRQLPPAVADFVGRTDEMDRLSRLLDESVDHGVSVVISAIAGTAGVGKTALAVQWARQVQDQFPDGQLYINLHGYDSGQPVTAGQALDSFLRALNVPAEKISTGPEEQAALYRSLLDGKRALVVLDNANSAAQVRPLLPGSPGCVAVITSRSRLSGLVARDGAHRVSLDPLPPAEAIALLRQIVGADRVDAEPQAAIDLARSCAHLPLAIRIAAERVAIRTHITLADLAKELADENNRLDVLSAGDDETTAVRTVFSWSYRALPSDAARMFRLLGLHTGPDISVAGATALAGCIEAHAERQMERLRGVHLLEETGYGRYRLHDLLRVYAAECAVAEEKPEDRDAAVTRVLAWHLHTVHNAGRTVIRHRARLVLDPPPAGCRPLTFDDHEEALAWAEAERINIRAATIHAHEIGKHRIAWQFAGALWGFYYLRKYWSDWIITHKAAIASAQHLHERWGEAALLTSLGLAYRDLRDRDKALALMREALAICREISDAWGEGIALACMGLTYYDGQELDQAQGSLLPALSICREFDDKWGEGLILTGLGNTYRDLGQFEEALEYYQHALVIYRSSDNSYGEAWTLHDLGNAYRCLGKLEEAEDYFRQALVIYRETGGRQGEAQALDNLGEVLRDSGHMDAACEVWHQALIIFSELDDPQAADVQTRLPAATPGYDHRSVYHGEDSADARQSVSGASEAGYCASDDRGRDAAEFDEPGEGDDVGSADCPPEPQGS